jgi:hypothetical protein
MRRVILESPFGQNPPLFIAYARCCVKDCLSRDEAPLASHLLYTQPGILDDAVAEERTLGIKAGLIWYEFAEAAVVYRDFGISSGMRQGIAVAEALGLPVEYRFLPVRPPHPHDPAGYPNVGEPFPLRRERTRGIVDLPSSRG